MRLVLVALVSVGILWGLTAGNAAECPGNANALGTSRVIAIDPTEHARLGTMQYAETLPLADKEVVLTFDDGPLPPYSTRILDILASECVKATYFIVGRMARAYPDVLRRIYAEGHTIGTHSQNHPMIFDRMPIEDVQSEVERGIASTAAALGNPKMVAPFFRIPGLARASSVETYLRSRGLMTWSADFDADDWRRIQASELIDRALRRIEVMGRGILLLHDIQPVTALALPILLNELKTRGYHIVHIVPASIERPKTVTAPQDWIVARSRSVVSRLVGTKSPIPGPQPMAVSTEPSSVYWNHSGSIMRLVSDGAKQKMFYETPRIGLVDAGIAPGTLLFEGQRNGPTLVGTAYQFYRACKSQGYRISGNTSKDLRQITLKGKVPLLDASCNITGSRDDILIFTATQSAPDEPPIDTPVAGAPVVNATAQTRSGTSATNNSVVVGAVVPSVSLETSRAPDIPIVEPIVEGSNAKSGEASAPNIAVSSATVVAPTSAANDKQILIVPRLESGTVPSSEPATVTQLAAIPENASNTANNPVAGRGAMAPSEAVKDDQPSTISRGDSAARESIVSNTENNDVQRSEPATQNKLPKDTQTAALPGAVGSATKTNDVSNSRNPATSAATGGAANNLPAANKSEVSIAEADITGALIESRTVPMNTKEKMMEIVLKNGRVLRIGRDIDPDVLMRIISLLER
jgi:peptidoglycan/xylan/chitin deacetylase (PgdA/CDA1 family)